MKLGSKLTEENAKQADITVPKHTYIYILSTNKDISIAKQQDTYHQ